MNPPAVPKYVIGLGNPGKKYENTRHNIGFRDVAATEERCEKDKVRKRHKGFFTKCCFEGQNFYTFRPRTYMNLSGRAVQSLTNVYKMPPEELLVITDCVDLPFGKLRLRKKGGSGGHRGLQSVIDCLGTTDFPRLRVGIGRENKPQMVQFVLSTWTREEERVLQEGLETMADAVLSVVVHGMDTGMNQYNNINPIDLEHLEQNKETAN